ncbi:MAG: hypothetical protein AAF541_15895 [Pseudomonadota bacterium]
MKELRHIFCTALFAWSGFVYGQDESTDYFLGSLGEARLVAALDQPWDHTDLVRQSGLLNLLGQALADGAITGYDLRVSGVYDRLEDERTLIYSHNSKLHLQALVNLLADNDVSAQVYLLPKVSAFLHRPQWGGDPDALQTLPNGLKVVNGREAAVLFAFADAEDKKMFHNMVQRYAKRNHEDQTDLLIHAWWQPFYYSAVPFADFSAIDLVVIRSSNFEATLTVLPDKTDSVVDAVNSDDFELSVDRVWVNRGFFRFLMGDFK